MQKITLVNRAHYKIAVSGQVTPARPESISNSLNILEDMMSEFEGWGIEIGYKFEETPKASTDSNIPFWATSPIYNNLAMTIIGSFEYEPNQILVNNASGGLSLLMRKTAKVNEILYPDRMPKGSGNTLRLRIGNRFYRRSNQ